MKRRMRQQFSGQVPQVPGWRFVLALLLAGLVAFAPLVKAACDLSGLAAAGGAAESPQQTVLSGTCHDDAARHASGLNDQLHAPSPTAALDVLGTTFSPPGLDVVPPAAHAADLRLAYSPPIVRRHATPPAEPVILRFGRLLI